MLEYLRDQWAKTKADLKKIHKSMTMWFNGLMAAIVFGLPQAVAMFPQMQDYLPETVFKHAMGILLVGNILLRFKTSNAMRDK